jgi:hypothetical protein
MQKYKQLEFLVVSVDGQNHKLVYDKIEGETPIIEKRCGNIHSLKQEWEVIKNTIDNYLNNQT